MDTLSFPFGRPVLARPPSAAAPRRLFLLGAYPSALHVAWQPPAPYRPIRAIAVDNEPEPFWAGGSDERMRIKKWQTEVDFDERQHGTVTPVGRLNGSSGAWVDKNVLAPLDAMRADAWITDCLDTYCCSTGLVLRIKDTYAPFASELNLPAAHLPRHPSEAQIVAMALRDHLPRLRQEALASRAETFVTLGNAALLVLRILAELNKGQDGPEKLVADCQLYARPIPVRIAGRLVYWLALAHPASPRGYQDVHREWMRRSDFSRRTP